MDARARLPGSAPVIEAAGIIYGICGGVTVLGILLVRPDVIHHGSYAADRQSKHPGGMRWWIPFVGVGILILIWPVVIYQWMKPR